MVIRRTNFNSVYGQTMKKIRVIIVESHSLMREALTHVLRSEGKVEMAGSCASHDDAILLCQSKKPDVVLFNIGMDLRKDLAMLTYLLDNFQDIKVVGMSVNSRPELAEKLLEAGAHGFVTKSSSRDEMIRAILEVSDGNAYICSETRLAI